MKKLLKWAAISMGSLLVIGFFAFLYLIPPFTLAPPESFIEPERLAPPKLNDITDPVQRALAERGRYITLSIGCTGCHTPGGDKGPKFDAEYFAGGVKLTDGSHGTVVSRNLTPDPATGLARRTDEQVLRVLTSGVSPDDGRIFSPFFMPWPEFSNMTEEDRHAVVTYLRHLKAVYHQIPKYSTKSESQNFSLFPYDYAIHEGSK